MPTNDKLNFIENQELDRKRIASELHDTSLQDLTHLIHQIELSSMYIDEDPIRAKLELEDVSNELRKVIQDIRNTIFDLRPMSFDDLGLDDAINEYISFIKKRCNCIFNTDIDDIDYINEKEKLAVYRIVQECLMNCAKHSSAKNVNLKLKDYETEILISVEDDGIGMENNKVTDHNNKHYGLTIIKDRVDYLNGICTIQSDKDKGTVIEIRIPNKKGDLL